MRLAGLLPLLCASMILVKEVAHGASLTNYEGQTFHTPLIVQLDNVSQNSTSLSIKNCTFYAGLRFQGLILFEAANYFMLTIKNNTFDTAGQSDAYNGLVVVEGGTNPNNETQSAVFGLTFSDNIFTSGSWPIIVNGTLRGGSTTTVMDNSFGQVPSSASSSLTIPSSPTQTWVEYRVVNVNVTSQEGNPFFSTGPRVGFHHFFTTNKIFMECSLGGTLKCAPVLVEFPESEEPLNSSLVIWPSPMNVFEINGNEIVVISKQFAVFNPTAVAVHAGPQVSGPVARELELLNYTVGIENNNISVTATQSFAGINLRGIHIHGDTGARWLAFMGTHAAIQILNNTINLDPAAGNKALVSGVNIEQFRLMTSLRFDQIEAGGDGSTSGSPGRAQIQVNQNRISVVTQQGAAKNYVRLIYTDGIHVSLAGGFSVANVPPPPTTSQKIAIEDNQLSIPAMTQYGYGINFADSSINECELTIRRNHISMNGPASGVVAKSMYHVYFDSLVIVSNSSTAIEGNTFTMAQVGEDTTSIYLLRSHQSFSGWVSIIQNNISIELTAGATPFLGRLIAVQGLPTIPHWIQPNKATTAAPFYQWGTPPFNLSQTDRTLLGGGAALSISSNILAMKIVASQTSDLTCNAVTLLSTTSSLRPLSGSWALQNFDPQWLNWTMKQRYLVDNNTVHLDNNPTTFATQAKSNFVMIGSDFDTRAPAITSSSSSDNNDDDDVYFQISLQGNTVSNTASVVGNTKLLSVVQPSSSVNLRNSSWSLLYNSVTLGGGAGSPVTTGLVAFTGDNATNPILVSERCSTTNTTLSGLWTTATTEVSIGASAIPCDACSAMFDCSTSTDLVSGSPPFNCLCTSPTPVPTPMPTSAPRSAYDPAVAMDALLYCKASYCDAELLGNWSCPTCNARLLQFESVNVSTNAATAYLAYTGYDNQTNRIMLVFRGTNNDVNWYFNNLTELVPLAGVCTNASTPGCPLVHKGFQLTWLSVSQQVLASTTALVAKYPNASGILITGHSLGGAIAVQAALATAYSFPQLAQLLYTFGAPRVGDPTFVAHATTMLQGGKQFRVTHKEDPIPRVPFRAQGYLHAPHELWYDNNGNSTWKNCSDNATMEDPDCIDRFNDTTYVARDHVMYLGLCTNCEREPDSEGHCPVAAPTVPTPVPGGSWSSGSRGSSGSEVGGDTSSSKSSAGASSSRTSGPMTAGSSSTTGSGSTMMSSAPASSTNVTGSTAVSGSFAPTTPSSSGTSSGKTAFSFSSSSASMVDKSSSSGAPSRVTSMASSVKTPSSGSSGSSAGTNQYFSSSASSASSNAVTASGVASSSSSSEVFGSTSVPPTPAPAVPPTPVPPVPPPTPTPTGSGSNGQASKGTSPSASTATDSPPTPKDRSAPLNKDLHGLSPTVIGAIAGGVIVLLIVVVVVVIFKGKSSGGGGGREGGRDRDESGVQQQELLEHSHTSPSATRLLDLSPGAQDPSNTSFTSEQSGGRSSRRAFQDGGGSAFDM